MSFVNDVMAEEASRKSLILFEDYSVFRDVDLPPVHDNAVLKKKYWLNFLLAMIILIIALGFIDQLPASKSYSVSKLSYSEELDLPVLSSTVIQETSVDIKSVDAKMVEESIEPVQIVQNKSVPDKKNIVQESSAEKTLEKTQIQLRQPVQKPSHTQVLVKSDSKAEQVLDLTDDKVVFNKQILADPTLNTPTQIKTNTQFSHAQLLLKQGEVVSAIAALQQVLSLNDHHLDARLLLSSKLIEQGQILEAINVYQKGLLLTPDEPRLAKPMAHLLVERGKIDQSLQVLQRAAPSAKIDPDYHSFIAALQQQTGKHEKAITIYQQILKSQPGNGKWWLGLGISLMAEARNKEALVAFESSLHDERVSSALKQFASQRITDLKINQSKNRGRS